MQNIRFKALVTEAENQTSTLADIVEFTDLSIGGSPSNGNIAPVYPRVVAVLLAGISDTLADLSEKLLREAE